MSVEERILAACCGDKEQADLVADMLARRIKPLSEPGEAERLPRQWPESREISVTTRPGSLSGFSCPNCLREWPEPFCEECGRRLPLKGDTR